VDHEVLVRVPALDQLGERHDDDVLLRAAQARMRALIFART
jgi:hypothetical protein